MAWRIHEHVLRGEIDNRTRNRVTGRIWLAGVDEPLVLDLKGNCYPDLAGCLLTFENPAPMAIATRPPALVQRGTAGDISAARKVRVFDLPMSEAYPMLKRGEKVPEHMANCLYAEWYSERSGRVVIESADYRLQISEPVWRFSAEELAERERLAAEGDKSFAVEIDADGQTEAWDEFRCEQLLRESDMTGEKYRRLFEQYADHPDGERIIAREMGWETLEEMLADQEMAEGGDAKSESAEFREEEEDEESPDEVSVEGGDDFEGDEDFEDEPTDPALEGIDWVHDKNERIMHPVAKRTRDLLYALFDEFKLDDENLRGGDEAISEFSDHLMVLSVKLSSALGFIARADRHMDNGMIIAWLKRALEIHNEVLATADSLNGNPRFPAARLDHYRAELFGIREDVLAVIARLRQAGDR